MPVYRSHLVEDYAELGLGQRIREMRHTHGLTLRELADRAGLSTPRLSRIENDLHVLDVPQAVALANALDVPWDSFLPADDGVPYQISREADKRSAGRRRRPASRTNGSEPSLGPNVFEPLADHFVGRHLEPVLGEIARIPDDQVQFSYQHEQAFMFVLKGSVELLMKTGDGVERHEIQRGDCAYYRSDVPHCLRSADAEAAETIHVLGSALAPYEGVTGWPAPVSASDSNDVLTNGFGRKIVSLREARGWTVPQVAHRAGMTERRLAQVEIGRRPTRWTSR